MQGGKLEIGSPRCYGLAMGSFYAEVIGDPIEHSKSPLIHGFWIDRIGMEASYRRQQVREADLPAFLERRRNDPLWRGCSVTMPHKAQALALADRAESEARATGAANLLARHGTEIVATNTDVEGILAALPLPALSPGDKVCIIGTGGAARAALAACKRRDIGIVLISARDVRTGWRLLEEFGFGGTSRPLDDPRNIQTAHVIINATPLGMTGQPELPPTILQNLQSPLHDVIVFDMVYTPVETAFLRCARAAGCHTVSGLEMLIGQAAAAFQNLFGIAAPRQHDAELRQLLVR